MNRKRTGWIAAISTIVLVSVALSAPVQAHLPTLGPATPRHGGSSGSSAVSPALTGPIYNNVTGWDGSRALYYTNYTSRTYLPSIDNSSFAFQNETNSSYHGCPGAACIKVANAEEVSVSTYGTNDSWYQFYPGLGWFMWSWVTDTGEATPGCVYIGPPGGPVVAYSGFQDLGIQLSNFPSSAYLAYWPGNDTGFNITDGNFVGSGGANEHANYVAIAGSLAEIALALAAVPGADAADVAIIAAEVGLALLTLTGAFSSTASPYDYFSQETGSGADASMNQWGQVTPSPSYNNACSGSAGGDYQYSQSGQYEVLVKTSGALPALGSSAANLNLYAHPSLGDNDNTWENIVNGANATLSYSLEPAVSLSGTVDLYPGAAAGGADPAIVLLQQSECPSGAPYGNANYYLTANASGGWHFFAAPGCTYTYSASDYEEDGQGQTLTSTSTTISIPTSAAGTSRTLATKVIGQLVTFEQSGLPSWDDDWHVTMNGAEMGAAPNPIQFVEPNASYPYTVTPPSPFSASPSSGTVTVSGSPVNVPTITMSTTATVYSVKFTESGLPSGVSWEVCMNNQCPSSSSTSHSISAYSGSYSWDAYDADVSTSGYYYPSPSSGTITVPTTLSVSVPYDYHSGTGGGGCVNVGTPVLTPTGYVPVQDLKTGQSIVEYSTSSGQFFVGTFLSAAVTDVSRVLSIDRGELVVTLTDQPIWIRNMTFEGWLHDPQNLTAGDFLFDPLTHLWIPITSLQILNENTHVYDVQTSVSNNYIANGILVDMKMP